MDDTGTNWQTKTYVTALQKTGSGFQTSDQLQKSVTITTSCLHKLP